MKFKTCYERNKRYFQDFNEPSLVDRSFDVECDLHYILNNFMRNGGTLDRLKDRQNKLQYGISPDDDSFEKANLLVSEYKSQFNDLPAVIRREFNDSVSVYLAYVSNPDNLKDCYERQLIDPNSVDIKDVYPEKFSDNVSSPPIEVSSPKPQSETLNE